MADPLTLSNYHYLENFSDPLSDELEGLKGSQKYKWSKLGINFDELSCD